MRTTCAQSLTTIGFLVFLTYLSSLAGEIVESIFATPSINYRPPSSVTPLFIAIPSTAIAPSIFTGGTRTPRKSKFSVFYIYMCIFGVQKRYIHQSILAAVNKKNPLHQHR